MEITQKMLMAAAHQASRNGLVPVGEFEVYIRNNRQLRKVLKAALDSTNYLRQARRDDSRRGIKAQRLVAVAV